MNRALRNTFVLTLGFLLVKGSAEVRTDAAQFAELCTYDDDCYELKTDEGTFIPPKRDVVEIVRDLNQPLQKYARDLGVDPVAVAGSIIAGHSLGAQMDDDTRQFYDAIKRTRFVNGLSHLWRNQSFSLGIAQIKPETAGDAEPMLAKLERRAPRTLDQISAALADPVESVKYAAAIIRQCQDAYEKRGFDVADDPALLATMYNVGGCPRRAITAVQKRRAPRVNFFGFFVRHYRDEIVKGAGLEDPAPAVVSQVAYSAPRSIARRLNASIQLAPYPPTCTGGTKVVASDTITAGGEYKVLAPGLDCDMNGWSLIQTARGEIGWASDVALAQRNETFAKEAAAECDPKTLVSCTERLRARLGKAVLRVDQDGFLEIDADAAASVTKIARDKCVEAIFVAAPALIAKVAGRPGTAFVKPFALKDRLAIKVLDGCNEVAGGDRSVTPGRTGATR